MWTATSPNLECGFWNGQESQKLSKTESVLSARLLSISCWPMSNASGKYESFKPRKSSMQRCCAAGMDWCPLLLPQAGLYLLEELGPRCSACEYMVCWPPLLSPTDSSKKKKKHTHRAAVSLLVGKVAILRDVMGLLDLLSRVLDHAGCFRLCSCHDLLRFGLDHCR